MEISDASNLHSSSAKVYKITRSGEITDLDRLQDIGIIASWVDKPEGRIITNAPFKYLCSLSARFIENDLYTSLDYISQEEYDSIPDQLNIALSEDKGVIRLSNNDDLLSTINIVRRVTEDDVVLWFDGFKG